MGRQTTDPGEAAMTVRGTPLTLGQSMAVRCAVVDRLYRFHRYSTRLGKSGEAGWDSLSAVQELIHMAIEDGPHAPHEVYGRTGPKTGPVSIGGVPLSDEQSSALSDAVERFLKYVVSEPELGPIGPLYRDRLREVMDIAAGG